MPDNPAMKKSRTLAVLAALAVFAAFLLASATAHAQTDRSYKVLATTKTSTMQKEMQDAGELGYRFVAVQGGETAIGGSEVVVLMEKIASDKTKYQYRLLATSKTSTLERELQDAADAGWEAVGQTVFKSTFGGEETVGLLERSSETPSRIKYDYKLIATSKTSTLEKELQQAARDGYQAVGMTVGKTSFGGSELVVITRKILGQ
jgi:hypothetical protein